MNETEMRELDAWIDVAAFGQIKRCLHISVRTIRGSQVECEACGERFGETTLCMAREAVPRYSTDERRAVMVLEKCRERVRAKCDNERQCSVRIDCDYPFTIYELESTFMECRFRVEADTLPLAICLFAKKLFS